MKRPDGQLLKGAAISYKVAPDANTQRGTPDTEAPCPFPKEKPE